MKWKTLILSACMSLLSLGALTPQSVHADISEYKSWKQSDPRWGSRSMGPCSETIASIGCKFVSGAMILVESGVVTDSNFDPGVLMDHTSGSISSTGNLDWYAFDGYNNSDFRFEGDMRFVDVTPDVLKERLKEYFKKDKIYLQGGMSYEYGNVVRCDHWVFLDEYDAANDKFHMCDPAAGTQDDFFNFPKYYPNAVHVYSSSHEPYSKRNITTTDITTEAAKVSEAGQVYLSNTHRLSEYSEDQKTTLAVLQEKTMNDAEYTAFKWNMVVSQFNVPYVESLQDTLNNNSAWDRFFSDGLTFNTNSYLKSIYGDDIPDTVTLPILQYIADLKLDMTTPIEKTVRGDTMIAPASNSDGVTNSVALTTSSSTSNFIDNKWATFLVGPWDPIYTNESQAKAVMKFFANDPNIGEVASGSLSTKNTFAGKSFRDIANNYGNSLGPMYKNAASLKEVDTGGPTTVYAYGKIQSIAQTYLDAMKADMSSSNIDTQTDSGSGMGYRTLYQASYDANTNTPQWGTNSSDGKNYWSRTLGMFSEHCTGTAIDFTQSYNMGGSAASADAAQFRWLADNAHKYGFIWRFKVGGSTESANGNRTGTIFEDWHWRFVGVYHATKFWEKCSSDGVTGYDTNSNYLWEDYYKENIEGQEGYPTSAYDALCKFYNKDDSKCTYKEYLTKQIDSQSSDSASISTSGNKVGTSTDPAYTETIVKEKSLILQAHALLKDKTLNYSQIYTDEGKPAVITDLWSSGYLTIKDTLAIAGATANTTNSVLSDSEDSASLKDSLWNCIYDFAKSSSGTTQDLWDKVLEANYNREVTIPVYIRSDVTDMYNMIFVANASRIKAVDYSSLMSQFSSYALVVDSWGNICADMSGNYVIVYPAYANNLFANATVDTGDIGTYSMNNKIRSLTYEELLGLIVKEDLDLDDFLTGTVRTAVLSDNLSDDIKNYFGLSGTGSITNISSLFDATNIFKPDLPLLQADTESIFITNKAMLSMYSRKERPTTISTDWYSLLGNNISSYKDFDFEKNVKSLSTVSLESRFYNSLLFSKYAYSASKLDNIYSRPNYIYSDIMLNKFKKASNGKINDIVWEMMTDNFKNLISNDVWLETSFNTDIMVEPLDTKDMYKVSSPIYPTVLKDPLNYYDFTSTDDTKQHPLIEKSVSDAMLNYPIEDICLISYIWNQEVFKHLGINSITVENNNLNTGVHYDEVITLPNALNSNNNKTMLFTRTSEMFEGFSYGVTVEHRIQCESNEKVYTVDYNLPVLMLAVNKNAYGENLQRLIKKLESGTELPVSILDRIWYVTKHPIESFYNLCMSFAQLLHNALTNLGLGNPFNTIIATDFILKYRSYIFVFNCILLTIGLTRVLLKWLTNHKIKHSLVTLIIRSIILSYVPLFVIVMMCDSINVVTTAYLNSITTKIVSQNLAYNSTVSKVVNEKRIFYDGINDADQEFYNLSIKMNDGTSVALSKLYNEVSFKQWHDTSIATPWYSAKEFIPVNADKYSESAFYYFYDWLTYQYLGYMLNKDPSCDVKLLVKPEDSAMWSVYESYKKTMSVGYKYYSELAGNIPTMYNDKAYSYSIIDSEIYTKDVLGLSKMLSRAYIDSTGNVNYLSDTEAYLKEIKDKFNFTSMIDKKDVEYYVPAILLNGDDVWTKSNKFTKHGYAFNSLEYMNLANKKSQLQDKAYKIPDTGRIPFIIYGAEANLVAMKAEPTALETKLCDLNDAFISEVTSSNLEELPDTDVIFTLAIKATTMFNTTFGLKGSTLDSSLSLSSVMKATYLPVSGNFNSFTYSLYRKYRSGAIMPFIIIISELFLVLTSLVRNFLLVLLVLTSIRFSMSIFLSKYEITQLFRAQLRQCLLYIIIYLGIIGSLLFASYTVKLGGYGVTSILIAVIMLAVYYSVLLWAYFQVNSLIKEFRTFGSTLMAQKIEELQNTVNAIFKGVSVSSSRVNRVMIHNYNNGVCAPEHVDNVLFTKMKQNIKNMTEEEEEEKDGT